MAIGASLFVAACGGQAPTSSNVAPVPSATAAPPTTAPPATIALTSTIVPATATASPATAVTPAVVAAMATSAAGNTTVSTSSGPTIDYKIVADGTQASYRVREQLVRLSAPSDAVGTTKNVTGDIVLDADGQVVSNQSKLVVDLSSLQSDSNMRDGFIQRSTLQTTQYPTATFVPTAVKGLSSPLPTSGQQTFQLIGDMTIHGVTRLVTLNVTTQVNGKDVTGQAITNFKFEDFGMTPPSSMAVLSVVDDVKLEVTLHLTQSA